MRLMGRAYQINQIAELAGELEAVASRDDRSGGSD
jgi:hypothetical protein